MGLPKTKDLAKRWRSPWPLQRHLSFKVRRFLNPEPQDVCVLHPILYYIRYITHIFLFFHNPLWTMSTFWTCCRRLCSASSSLHKRSRDVSVGLVQGLSEWDMSWIPRWNLQDNSTRCRSGRKNSARPSKETMEETLSGTFPHEKETQYQRYLSDLQASSTIDVDHTDKGNREASTCGVEEANASAFGILGRSDPPPKPQTSLRFGAVVTLHPQTSN